MHLLSCLHLLIEQFFLLLLLSFLLLVANEIFDHVGFGNVLIVLLIVQLFLLHLLFFCVINVLLYLITVCSFIVHDFLTLLFLLGFVQ